MNAFREGEDISVVGFFQEELVEDQVLDMLFGVSLVWIEVL